MLFTKKFFALLLLLQLDALAVPLLKTKQDVNKIRFISKQGAVTYYQKSSGELQMSTNYNFKNVFTGPKNTEYKVFASSHEEKVLFTVDEFYFSKQNALKDKPIYMIDLKAKKDPIFIGSGTSPHLHLQDQYATFYNHKNKEIVIYNFSSPNTPRKIKLNKAYPYFSSQQVLITPNDILYTDINKDGFQAVLLYSLIENSFKTVHKAAFNSYKLEICQIENNVYIGEFPLIEGKTQSQIIEVPLYNNKNFINKNILYTSKLPDLGQLTCANKNVFFLKTQSYSKRINLYKTDVAKINLKDKRTEVLTSEGDFDQILNLGHFILGYRMAKYYIINGEENAISDEIKKEKK